jgi:hypothetical protein
MFTHKVIMLRTSQETLFENESPEFTTILAQLKDLRIQSSGFISDEESISDDKLTYTKWNNWQSQTDYENYCTVNKELATQYIQMRVLYNNKNNIKMTIEDSTT